MTDHVIELRDVHYSIGEHRVFAGLNVQVPRGCVTAIMGPSGVGKTTLLRLITGQIRPSQGAVLVDGQAVATLVPRALRNLRLRMGVVFQEGALFTDLNVFENVAFPLREHTRLPESLIRLIVLMKLQAVGLRGAAQLMPAELSGGMARRVAIARAIAMDPPLLFCDEPFNGLDPISAGVVVRLLRQMNAALHMTVIVVSHEVRQVERVANLSYLLANGRVAASGPPRQVRDDNSDVVRQFMTGSADGPVPFHYPAPDYHEQLLSRREPSVA